LRNDDDLHHDNPYDNNPAEKEKEKKEV